MGPSTTASGIAPSPAILDSSRASLPEGMPGRTSSLALRTATLTGALSRSRRTVRHFWLSRSFATDRGRGSPCRRRPRSDAEPFYVEDRAVGEVRGPEG